MQASLVVRFSGPLSFRIRCLSRSVSLFTIHRASFACALPRVLRGNRTGYRGIAAFFRGCLSDIQYQSLRARRERKRRSANKAVSGSPQTVLQASHQQRLLAWSAHSSATCDPSSFYVNRWALWLQDTWVRLLGPVLGSPLVGAAAWVGPAPR